MISSPVCKNISVFGGTTFFWYIFSCLIFGTTFVNPLVLSAHYDWIIMSVNDVSRNKHIGEVVGTSIYITNPLWKEKVVLLRNHCDAYNNSLPLEQAGLALDAKKHLAAEPGQLTFQNVGTIIASNPNLGFRPLNTVKDLPFNAFLIAHRAEIITNLTAVADKSPFIDSRENNILN